MKVSKWLALLLFVFHCSSVLAVECADIFSNSKSFNANGGASVDSSNECNSGSCTPVPGFTPVVPFPTIPFGGAFTSTTITDGPSYYTSWGLPKESEVEFSGSGTAVLYFSGSVSIPKETEINEDGDPSNVMIIVNGSLSIAKDSEINAFIYVTGAITIAKDVEFEGSIAANGSMSVAKDGEYDFDSDDLNDLNSHGFCDASGPNLVAHYKMDEASWGSVIDSINGFNGTAFNGANTVGSSCRYGEFDGVNDYVQIPHDPALNGSSELTYAALVRADSWTGVDQILAKSVHGGGSGRAQMGLFSENGVLKGRAETENGRKEITATLPLVAQDWVHLALVFDGTSLRLYQDGVQVAVDTFSSTTLKQTTDPLNISKRVGTSAYYFDGLIDDVRVYTSALTAQEINDLIATLNPCALTSLDHFEITHDGNGLTCDSETVSIKACADSNCTILSNDPVTLDLTGNGNVKATTTFTGSTNITFNHTVAETIALDVANSSEVPTNGTECVNGASTSCNMQFSDAGFRFLYNGTTTIANQTAGVTFSQPLALQAVENTNGVCTGIFSGNVNVNLSQENVSPSGTTGLSFQENGANLAKFPAFTNNVTLNFSANSTATLTSPRYLDAGQIRLRASYSSGGVSLEGASNSFWVKPDKLVVEAKSGGTDLNGVDRNASVSHKAGQPFDFIVTAVNSLGNVTPNYQPGSIELTHTRVLPTDVGSANGVLTYAAGGAIVNSTSGVTSAISLTPFSSGISSYSNASYDEVGIINIDVEDVDYGGQSIAVEADAITVGRFKPDHFIQTIENAGAYTSSCNSGASTFAYIGQTNAALGTIRYGFSLAPQIKIAAYNASGALTENFNEDSDGSANDFMTLVASDVTLTPPMADSTALGLDNNPIAISASLSTGTIAQSATRGEVIYTLSDNDRYYYIRNANAKVTPFMSDINIEVASIVSDGVSATTLTDIDGTSPISIRYGRLYIENGFGPETEALRVSMQAQYYDGSSFVVNTDDNCTTLPVVTKVTTGNLYDSLASNQYRLLDNVDSEPVTVTDTSIIGSGTVSNGLFDDYQFTAPGANKRGALLMEYEAPSWLKYDWSTTDNNPSATLTFGLFRGNDRIISWREISN